MEVRGVRIGRLALLAVAGCGGGWDKVLDLEGDRLQGEIQYSQNCVSCHGETGFGGIGPSLVERIQVLTDEEILTAIEEGPGDMTSFEGQFTNQELADLLLYVTSEFQ